MKNFLKLFLIIYVLGFACFASAATSTTGFIPGQIWYSKDPFIEGDTVKIYTALWNNGTTPLSAKVEFYDKNVILGTRDITVPASKLQEVYVSWKVTAGDHLISAKIISPSVTLSGKKETVSLSNNMTEVDKRFVPVVVNTMDGTPASSADIIKSQVDKATSAVGDILPESISTPAGESVSAVDSFRVDTLKTISEAKDAAEKKIEELKKAESSNTTVDSKNVTKTGTSNTKNTTTGKVSAGKVGVEDATEKPITYLKFFFLSILSFIFGSKIVFYLLIALVIFFLLRFIYRKIRRR